MHIRFITIQRSDYENVIYHKRVLIMKTNTEFNSNKTRFTDSTQIAIH